MWGWRDTLNAIFVVGGLVAMSWGFVHGLASVFGCGR